MSRVPQKRLKIAYFGTPDFAVPTLELLSQHPLVDLSLVVSMPDRPADRGKKLKSPPVVDFCRAKKIPFWQTENINRDEELKRKLKDENVDALVVLAFAQFLCSEFLSLPALGAFNIHTSLLPKYRGAAPIQYALLNGDSETGVAIQKIVPQMDAGDIAYTKKMAISPVETGGSLYTRLKFEAALGLNAFLYQLAEGSLQYTTQNHGKATYAPALKKEDGWLHFHERDAKSILNQIRAFQPWPGTFCYLDKKRLKVFHAELVDKDLIAGDIEVSSEGLVIGTKTQSLLLNDIQLEGKKRLSGKDFVGGLSANKKPSLDPVP